MRIAIGLEYDGSGFHGWQSQAHGQTIQDHLEQALAVLAGHPLRVHAAGRTDTGVHALGQVVHFDTGVERPLQAWIRGVNAHLSPAIAVRWAVQVDERFHARFSATSRHYRYILLNHPVRPAINHGRVGWHHRSLDCEAMAEAMSVLRGEHDFSSFRSSECQAATPIKTLHTAQVRRSGEYLVFDFHAGGFLHHMVRNIVGALIWVGGGKKPPSWMAELLAAHDRSRAAPTFEPDGLYFMGAQYDAHWSLPAEHRIIGTFDAGLLL